jgi:HlyD family secretion protein
MVQGCEQRLNAAKFALRQAKEKLAMALAGGRQEDIQVANASVDEIKGNVQKLEAQIEQTYIRAPVEGLITKRNAHIGDIASAGATMFEMARNNRLELRAQVPEADLKEIKPGQSVSIKCALTGEEPISGRVREISPAVDGQTRLATVRIDIPSGRDIKPGMYAEGRINIGKYPCLTVPARAVITENEKTTVFILADQNRVQRHVITTGARTGDSIEVKSGLTADQRVVVDGAGFLKDGDMVSVSK